MESKFRKFEEINIGDSDSFEVEVTPEMIVNFAKLSGDQNSLHIEHGVAHGMLLASLLSRFVGMYLPGRNSLYLSQTLNFKNPVRAGDVLRVEGKITATSESTKVLTIQISVSKSTGEIALEGEAKVLYRELN